MIGRYIPTFLRHTPGPGVNGFAILAGVSVVRHYGSDPPCRCSSQGVDYYQKLHKIVVHRMGKGLDNKGVCASDTFSKLH